MENLLIELNNLTGWGISYDLSFEDTLWEIRTKWQDDQAFGEWTPEVRQLVQQILDFDPIRPLEE